MVAYDQIRNFESEPEYEERLPVPRRRQCLQLGPVRRTHPQYEPAGVSAQHHPNGGPIPSIDIIGLSVLYEVLDFQRNKI